MTEFCIMQIMLALPGQIEFLSIDTELARLIKAEEV